MSTTLPSFVDFLFSTTSDKYYELQAVFDALLQTGIPQNRQIARCPILSRRLFRLAFAFGFLFVCFCSFVLLRIAQRLVQALTRPPDPRGDGWNCRCGHANLFIHQANPPLSLSLNSFELPGESTLREGTDIGYLPKRLSSPSRASKVSTRPIQGDGPNSLAIEPLTCSSCGRPASIPTHDRRSRGTSKSAVQTNLSQVPGDSLPPTSLGDLAPLQRSLRQGSSNLPKPSRDDRDILSLNILVIAKSNYKHHRSFTGPQLDTAYILKEAKDLPGVFIDSVSDGEATLDEVDKAIERVWIKAPDGSHLVFLLTGHGGSQGMILEEHLQTDVEIDENHIQQRLLALNSIYPKDLLVTTVFDICRDEDPVKVVAHMDRRISLIWSCLLGQTAQTLEFKPPKRCEGLVVYYHHLRNWWLGWWYTPARHPFSPGSHLLLAAVKAYQDVSENKGSFRERLDVRMIQLARFRSYVYHTSSPGGVPVCAICVRDEVWCPSAFDIMEGFKQNIDLEHYWGHLDRLLEFLRQRGYIASLPDVASRFFLRLDAFDKRSKHSTQLAYVVIRVDLVDLLDLEHPIEEGFPVAKKGSVRPIKQAEKQMTKSQESPTRPVNSPEIRGMQVPVACAPGPV
ncbi:hypothetical protein RhiLY_03278 [Ceratobasidium sp. AG-Ba]|nr:hypothetical protein RhiLY_03278 [Ceratobasidium sp. AG-Ba]